MKAKQQHQENTEQAESLLSMLAAPARRALESKGIASLRHLATFSEEEILQLHGMGPSSIVKLRAALAAENLTFRNN